MEQVQTSISSLHGFSNKNGHFFIVYLYGTQDLNFVIDLECFKSLKYKPTTPPLKSICLGLPSITLKYVPGTCSDILLCLHAESFYFTTRRHTCIAVATIYSVAHRAGHSA